MKAKWWAVAYKHARLFLDTFKEHYEREMMGRSAGILRAHSLVK